MGKGHGSDKCLPQFKVCPHGFVEKFGGCYSFAEKHCPHGSVHKHGKCVFISTEFAKKVCKHSAKKCFPTFKVCPHGFHAKQFKCVKQATKFVHKVCPHGFTFAPLGTQKCVREANEKGLPSRAQALIRAAVRRYFSCTHDTGMEPPMLHARSEERPNPSACVNNNKMGKI